MPARTLGIRLFRTAVVGVALMSAGFEAMASETATAPPAATPERVQRGRVLFAKHCASCHGPTGAGDGKAAHDLDPQPTDLRDPDVAGKSGTKLYRQITRGRAPMPSFARLLNDDDRWTLVVFVKTLNSPRESAAGR